MHDNYDAIVIGSGLGGLTAGALFAKAGKKVLVLERNDSFGGAATTYQRGAMTIEASLHETTDPQTTTDPKSEIFEALELYDDIEFVPVNNFYEVRSPHIGPPLSIPHGFDALREQLTERFPNDADAIRRFLKQINLIQKAWPYFGEKHDGRWWLSHGAELPFRLWPVIRDARSSVSDVLERFFGGNEAIKFALGANLCYYSDDPDQMWWLFYALAQGGFLHGGGNFIKGGSQVLSEQLVSRIREGGGEALAGQTAIEVLLGENGQATGVRYRPRAGDEGSVAHASIVFANAAPHVVENMLPEAERDKFMSPYRNAPLSISLFSITLGLSRKPSSLGISAYSTLLYPEWMQRLSEYKLCATLLADMPVGRLPVLAIVDYSQIDSGLKEGDLYPVNIVSADQLSNWEGLSDDEYRAKKDAWLNAIIQGLDDEWPGFARAIVQREFSTARTMHEYLNTPGGAIYGFANNVPGRKQSGVHRSSPKTSIRGLWLASAYGGGGGFSGAMSAGGVAARSALKAST